MSASFSYTEGHSPVDYGNVYIAPTAAAASSVVTSSPLHVLMAGKASSLALGSTDHIMDPLSPNSLLVKARDGMITSDSVPLVQPYSRTLVPVSSSGVSREMEEPGSNFLITIPLFDC